MCHFVLVYVTGASSKYWCHSKIWIYLDSFFVPLLQSWQLGTREQKGKGLLI